MGRVILSEEEHLMGCMAGVFRRVRSVALGKRDNAGHSGSDVWTMEIEGCCAEMAAAKHLGVYWTGQEGKNSQDILGFEVRWTRWQSGRLRVAPDDDDDVRFLLVTGQLGSYDVFGWMMGKDAKQQQWKDNPGGRRLERSELSYWVPQSELRTDRP